ncbi:serine/arginine repetitive matrix protein 2-like isoform X2 [Dermacentor silvarum]|uniref:serine/arginine repetitive matrix protein 2-like isoform X2 n=1 Tax=Dermacentor silvarum TaxID=543639 RepID=UPI0021014494|nr:serine/arginine repetitive matrix protein 2-like isoform X2 [Dermacentor silvarum]
MRWSRRTSRLPSVQPSSLARSDLHIVTRRCAERNYPALAFLRPNMDVDMRPVKKVDEMADQPHEKPIYERSSRERRKESDMVATVIAANTQEDAAKRHKNKTRGAESVDKKIESREHSYMDNSTVRKKRKLSRKKSKDSAASPSEPAWEQGSQSIIVPWCEERPQKKRSGCDRSTNKVRGHGIQTLETMLTEKDHQIGVNGLDRPPCAVAAETKQQLGDGGSNDARLTISDADLVNKEPPTQTDARKTEKAVTSHIKSKRESFSRSKCRHEKRKSKPDVGSHHGSSIPAATERATKIKKLASIDGSDKEKQAGKRPPQEDTRIKLAKTHSGQVLQQPEASKAHVNGTAREDAKVPEAYNLTEPEKQATTKDIGPIRDSPSAQSRVPSSQKPHPAPSTSGPSARRARSKSVASTQSARRKQSVVSFGADVKELRLEAELLQSLPEAPMALAHLKEMTATGSRKRRRSTIPRTSSSMAVLRRSSSADFGDTRNAAIRPVDPYPGVAQSRLQSTCSRTSRRSTGSLATILDTDVREQSRQTFTLRRTSRLRSLGGEETTSRSADYRPSMIGSQIGTQFMTTVRKTKVRSVRTDVHNAFLLGPSLMTVLGNICSFHEGSNKRALKVACHVEPAPLSHENVAVIRAAQERSAVRGRPRGVEFACATYLAIFTLSYAPSLVLGLEQRMAVVGALASMMIATSVLTSCIRAAFEFLRHVWQILPWGILLLLGATQVASKLLQTHGLLFEAFKSVSMTAWEERSVLEVQAMLAFAASVMAETTDKQVIVDIMAPMVIHISELKQMHPAYYAIPVIVGASSNFIMPASVPLAILHDLSRVSFWKLFLLGMFAKIVVMSMVIVAVNVVERAGFLGGQAPAQ